MKNLKRNLTTFGLAATLIFNAVGCTNSQNNSSSNISLDASVSEEIKVYNTNNYFFVYLDGSFYLTTRKYIDSKYNEKGNYIRPHYEYYDIKTGECVGNTLKTYYTGDIYKDEDKKLKRDVAFADYMDFEDKYGYGYGKIIPEISIIPLNQIMDSKGITESELEFFGSNSEELKDTLKSLIVYNDISVKDYVNMKKDLIFRSMILYYGDSEYTKGGLQKFVCENKDGSKEVLLGYRCSYYEGDMGQDYVYDILTGTITYIGLGDNNSYVSVNVYSYDNSDNLTLKEIQKRFASLDENVKVSDSSQKMTALDIVVLDTSRIQIQDEWDLNFIDGASYERFYFLCDTKERAKESNSKIFDDLFNDADMLISDTLNSYFYNDYNVPTVIMVDQKAPSVFRINDYLSMIGRDDLIKDEYTLEEISEIRDVILGRINSKTFEISD